MPEIKKTTKNKIIFIYLNKKLNEIQTSKIKYINKL